jgi:hypothetical protein
MLPLVSRERGNLPHVHRWRMLMHVDGCHWFTFSYTCECGATMNSRDERDPEFDPWSVMWYADDCGRCNELAKGARGQHAVMVVSRDGSTEVERVR